MAHFPHIWKAKSLCLNSQEPVQCCSLHAEHFGSCHFAQGWRKFDQPSVWKPDAFSVAAIHLHSHLSLLVTTSNWTISRGYFRILVFFPALRCKYTELTSKVLTMTVFVLQSSLVNRLCGASPNSPISATEWEQQRHRKWNVHSFSYSCKW